MEEELGQDHGIAEFIEIFVFAALFYGLFDVQYSQFHGREHIFLQSILIAVHGKGFQNDGEGFQIIDCVLDMIKAIFLDGLWGNNDGLDWHSSAGELEKMGEGGYLHPQSLVEA